MIRKSAAENGLDASKIREDIAMVTQKIPDTEFLMDLGELRAVDRDRVGPKAANEAELLRAGFTVPNAIVLTTDAFHYFLEDNHIETNKDPMTILTAPIPKVIRDALHSGIAELGSSPVAVRSSAIAEDLGGA
jgi:pyruvate,water dikinase